MKIQNSGEILSISEIKELGAANSETFRQEVREALPIKLKAIEVDLSQTQFVDSCGLGALIGIYKMASSHNGGVAVRLLNPKPSIQQIFELTRLHRIFEIVKR